MTLAKGTGATAIKIYANLLAELVAKIVAEAHRQGMQAWAHSMVFPATPREVIDAKPDSASHIGYFGFQAMDKRPQKYQEREKFPIDPAPFANGDNKIMSSLFIAMKERKSHPRRYQLRLRNNRANASTRSAKRAATTVLFVDTSRVADRAGLQTWRPNFSRDRQFRAVGRTVYYGLAGRNRNPGPQSRPHPDGGHSFGHAH